MKKRIFAILLCIALSSILCVTAFATEDIGIIGGADGDTQIVLDDEDIIYDEDVYDIYDPFYDESYYDYYYDEEFMAEVESDPVLSILAEEPELLDMLYTIGTENIKTVILCSTIATIFMLLFTPALVVMIVFAVLNGKTKKKIKEYEMKMSAPAYFAQPNVANLNYQPQPAAQPQVNQAPVLNGEPQTAENAEGGEVK